MQDKLWLIPSDLNLIGILAKYELTKPVLLLLSLSLIYGLISSEVLYLSISRYTNWLKFKSNLLVGIITPAAEDKSRRY